MRSTGDEYEWAFDVGKWSRLGASPREARTRFEPGRDDVDADDHLGSAAHRASVLGAFVHVLSCAQTVNSRDASPDETRRVAGSLRRLSAFWVLVPQEMS